MRILVLNQYFHPDGASSAQLLTELCEDLAAHHDVWVVTGRPSYNVAGLEPVRGFVARQKMGRVHLLRVWSTSFNRARMIGRIANYVTFLGMSFVGAFLAPRPSVVMTWTDPPPVVTVGALIARIRHVPYVLSCQDIHPESTIVGGELRNPIVIRSIRWAMRVGFRRAKSVVAIGDDMRGRMLDLGVPASKVTVIRNWSDGRLIHPLDGPNPFRQERGWQDTFVVMHSGNLGMGQDIDALIDAAALLREESGIVFAIVGEGMRKSHWENKVRDFNLDNVEFVPFQPKELIGYSLGAADVHVVAHLRGMEGYQVPSKLYGILATGRPCIAAVAQGSEVATTVERAGCGLVVDPDDAPAIASAILQIRDAPEAGFGERARAVFEREFDRPVATGAYRALLEKVAEGG